MGVGSARVVVLTGSELRHRFVRKALAASDINVVGSVCEDLTGALVDRVGKKRNEAPEQAAHLEARAQSEEDFFGWFDRYVEDRSNPIVIPRGTVNSEDAFSKICAAEPDLIVSYGCSILRGDILSVFPRRILNVHLGLSPYYRGSGTNFWPLVNGEPELVGATFMYLDAGIDTGEIIHQMRARIFRHDNPHQIGNRLIADMVPVLASLAQSFDELPRMPQPSNTEGRECRMRDLTEESVENLYEQFSSGLVARYLSEKERRVARRPIVENPAVAA